MALVKRPKVELSQGTPETCEHPGDIAGMCVKCGRKIEVDDGDNYLSRVPLGYIHKDFRVSNSDLLRLRANDLKKLLLRKKLYLVLDLDHTLLNSTFYPFITPCEEEYFKEAFPDTLFRLENVKMLTKLRPFVRDFLKEASNLFEMCIYSMGGRQYALQMAKLLDPEDVYFNSRVISRDDSTERNRKSLDVVVGHEKAVIIVDDSARVWEKHRKNVIKIKRYHYFASSCKRSDRKSYSEERCDESESNGALAAVLEVLKGIHSLFFDEECKVDLVDRDVRKVIRIFRKKLKLLQERNEHRIFYEMLFT